MAFTKEVLDAILKDYHGPDDFYGPEGIMKQLTNFLLIVNAFSISLGSVFCCFFINPDNTI
jgi:hypothetical protein